MNDWANIISGLRDTVAKNAEPRWASVDALLAAFLLHITQLLECLFADWRAGTLPEPASPHTPTERPESADARPVARARSATRTASRKPRVCKPKPEPFRARTPEGASGWSPRHKRKFAYP